MKAFWSLLFFVALSEIAVATPPMALSPEAPNLIEPLDYMEAPSKIDVAKSALADCVQQAASDVTPITVIAAYPVILLVLRGLAEILGRAAAAGSTSASTVMIGLRYLIALLGWIMGKGGLGTPQNVMVKTLPKYKQMKEAVKS